MVWSRRVRAQASMISIALRAWASLPPNAQSRACVYAAMASVISSVQPMLGFE